MMKSLFRNTMFISILGHVTVFSLFAFSFGNIMPKSNFAHVYSFGTILGKYDLIPCSPTVTTNVKRDFKTGFKTTPINNPKEEYPLVSEYYLKPQVRLSINEEKLAVTQKLAQAPFIKKRKEQVIVFHPHLPYHFLLFFKDRQAVHIELMFNIETSGGTNSISIKRKISSGNLEADLLSMRYISHYLFLQQTRFTADNWQTVKIDLSTKND